jgi:hypothetical protein
MLSPRFEKDSEASQRAPLSELWGILCPMMQKHSLSRLYCIIDGLDMYCECMVELVQKLLSLFATSESKAPRSLKLLCTSRPERGVMELWEGYSTRHLPAEGHVSTDLGDAHFMHAKTRLRSCRFSCDRMRTTCVPTSHPGLRNSKN